MVTFANGTNGTNGMTGAIPFSRPDSLDVSPKATLGFVGLGGMGSKIARNLASYSVEHGHPAVHVYNRSRSKAEDLQKFLGNSKIVVADSPAQLALECDVIVTMLGSDDAVRATYKQYDEALKTSNHTRTKIFVEMSTIYPTILSELDQSISAHPNTRLIACPVFGPQAVADTAELILAMSGDYKLKQEVAYILCPAIGRKVYNLGEDIEKAHMFKLVGNTLILGSIELLSETATMSEKLGIGAEQAFELVKDMMPAPPMVHYMGMIVRREFDGSKNFNIDGAVKDSTHMRKLTAKHNVPMPVIEIAHQHLLTARATHAAQKAKGEAEVDVLDWSGLVAGNRLAAGMGPFNVGDFKL